LSVVSAVSEFQIIVVATWPQQYRVDAQIMSRLAIGEFGQYPEGRCLKIKWKLGDSGEQCPDWLQVNPGGNKQI